MSTNFLQDLFKQNLAEEINVEDLRSNLEDYTKSKGWKFYQASGSNDLSFYRHLLNRPDAPERRLVGAIQRDSGFHIVAPTNLMATKYRDILFPQAPLDSPAVQKVVATMQTHEVSEAYERARGVTGKFGSHASPEVIKTEFAISKMLGKDTFRDIVRFREWELEQLPLRGFTGEHWEKYSASVKNIISQEEKTFINQGVIDILEKKGRDSLPSKFLSFANKHRGKFILGGFAAVLAANRFMAMDDSYNTIEGMPHGGLAEKQRKMMTDFGSKYDSAKAIARMMNQTWESFSKSKVFQEALSSAKAIKSLGSGRFGRTYLMETEIAGQQFHFAKKKIHRRAEEDLFEKAAHPEKYVRSLDLRHEAKMMRPLGETDTVASVYRSSKNEMFYEYMPGENIGNLYDSGMRLPRDAQAQMLETIDESARQGIRNLDVHHGNVLFDKSSGRVSWIDWGQAEKVSDPFPQILNEMEIQSKPFLFPKRKHPVPILRTTPNMKRGRLSKKGNQFDGLPHKGIAKIKRKTETDFGSRWRGLFGGISRKIAKYLGRGTVAGSSKLLNPIVAADAARGATLEQFVKRIGESGVIAREAQGEAIFTEMAKSAPGLEGGAAYVTFATGQSAIMMSPSRLRSLFTKEGLKRGVRSDVVKKAVESEDFLKTVFFHEVLEKQAAKRFSQLQRMPGLHNAAEVIIGEGGFLKSLGNESVTELFTSIRKARPEEYKALHAGFEAFTKEGISPQLRKLTTDFSEGYKGLLNSSTLRVGQTMVNSKPAKNALIKSARDLRIAQEQLWKRSREAGTGHSKYAGEHVRQLSRFGGNV